MKKTKTKTKMSVLFAKVRSLFEDMDSTLTDKGELFHEGAIAVGSEVFIKTGEDFIPAPDGDYLAEDQVISVKDGVVTETRDVDPSTNPQTENMEDVVSREEFDSLVNYVDELEKRIIALESIANIPTPKASENSRYKSVMRMVKNLK